MTTTTAIALADPALSARLTDRVRANLRYEYEFDRARPAGPSRVDQRLFTTLGVDF